MPQDSSLRYVLGSYETARAEYGTEFNRMQNGLFVAGGIGGIFTVMTGHPLDTIKVLLQTKPEKYEGIWGATKKIVSQEGPLSLYKGVTAPLLTVVPTFSIGFLGYGYGKLLVSDPDQESLTASQVLFAGLMSGASTTIVTIPSERIKCLLQLQANLSKYNGFMDCGMKLWKDGGIRNLYIGTCATLLRDVPATGLYFCTYEEILRVLTNEADHVTWQPLLAGGCAGVINWLVSMPFDTMKSKLQTSTPREYPRGMRSVFPVIMKKDGISGFYRGIAPVLIRAFPANAACFWGYEICMSILDKYVPWI